MIIDCHTHINCASDEAKVSEHLASAEKVDRCIVLAGDQSPSADTNKELSEYIAKHKNKMVGFAVVDPTQDNISVKNLTPIKDKLALSGTVLYCANHSFHPAHSRAMRFYESAEQLDLPVFFHNDRKPRSQAVLDFAQPYLLDEIARKFPALKIIIGTMETHFVDQTLAMTAKHENVYADLTIIPGSVWQVYNTILTAHESGIMDKLLFGSGFPVGRVDECMETLLGFNKLLSDTNLPTVPRGSIRNVIERDTLALLGINI